MVQLIREITETHGEVTIGVLGAIINERAPIFSPNRNRLASPSSSSHSFLREAVPM